MISRITSTIAGWIVGLICAVAFVLLAICFYTYKVAVFLRAAFDTLILGKSVAQQLRGYQDDITEKAP